MNAIQTGTSPAEDANMCPLYEYQCPECNATLDRLEPFQSPKPVCIHCHGAEMERKVSAGTAWWFKGDKG